MTRENITGIERIFWLMTHPEATSTEYMQKFELSRRTFSRDKCYIATRLWNYEVKQLK